MNASTILGTVLVIAALIYLVTTLIYFILGGKKGNF